jgi:aryl-alcohol dehydrogenase-like predicted oxidoreductase
LSTRHAPAEIGATLLEAFDRGINFFDTADIYGQGDSERLLGKLFRDKRDKVIFCSKAGLTINLSQTFIRWVKPFVHPILRRWKTAMTQMMVTRQQSEGQCFNSNYLRNQIESSLRRLKTDYLDLFLLHNPPKTVSSDENVFEMLEKLRQQGMIRFYGISCNTAEVAMAFMTRDGVACLQVPANIMQSEVLNLVLPAAQEKDLAIISREPFAGGSIFSHAPFNEFCEARLNRKAPRVALQYLLQRNGTGVVLIGMTCRKNLYGNLNAFEAAPLSEKETQIIEKSNAMPVLK